MNWILWLFIECEPCDCTIRIIIYVAPICSSIIAISERHSERHKPLDSVSAEIHSTCLRHLGWSPLALMYAQVKQRGNSVKLGTVSYENDLQKLVPGNQINPTFIRILCPQRLKAIRDKKEHWKKFNGKEFLESPRIVAAFWSPAGHQKEESISFKAMWILFFTDVNTNAVSLMLMGCKAHLTLQQRYLQNSTVKSLKNVMPKIHLLFSAGYSVVRYWRDTRWEQTGSWRVLQALLLAFNKSIQVFCLL